MRIFILVVCGVMLAAQHANAQRPQRTALTPSERAIEVALSDEALQFRYRSDGSIVNVKQGRLYAGLFVSEDRDVVGSAALLVPIDVPLGKRLSLQLGPQAYMALLSDEENSDVLALALGAELRFALLSERQIELVGSGYYSPDVITFGSADNLFDLEARIEARLTERAVGILGARWFELDLTTGDERTLQDELFLGVRVGLR